MARVLILGGTTEAADLARRVTENLSPGVEVTTSLAGRLKPQPGLPGHRRPGTAGTIRVGGFGGAGGLAEFIRREAMDVLIDATHPFAAAISAHARQACGRTATPRLILMRPPWRPTPGDRWIMAPDLDAAARRLPPSARRVFLTTGLGGIEAFAAVEGVHFLVRAIQAPPDPLPLLDYTLIPGRPPYALAGETAIMEEHAIDALVTKESGGGATKAKLTAARMRGIPVIMIARPPAEPGPRVETADEALAWITGSIRER